MEGVQCKTNTIHLDSQAIKFNHFVNSKIKLIK